MTTAQAEPAAPAEFGTPTIGQRRLLVIIGALLLGLLLAALDQTVLPSSVTTRLPHKIDYLGTALLAAAATSRASR